MKASTYLAIATAWLGLGVLAAHSASHPLQIEWQAVFGGDQIEYPKKVVALRDGGCIVGTTSFSPASGNKAAPKYSVASTSSDAWLVKIGREGQKVWDYRFGGTNGTGLFSLAERLDGTLVVLTASEDGVSGNRGVPSKVTAGSGADAWVIFVDAHGHKIRETAYGGGGPGGYIPWGGIVVTSDGGFAFAGEVTYLGVAWIVRADPQGGVIWEKQIDAGKRSRFTALALTPDGGFVCAGTTFITDEETGGDIEVGLWVRFSASGEELWRRVENDSFLRDTNRKVIVTNDGGFLSGGSSFPAFFQLVRRDPAGNVLWAQASGSPKFVSPRYMEQLYDMLLLKDGGALLFGVADGAGHGFPIPRSDRPRTGRYWGSQDYWLVRFDKNGTQLWDESFGADRTEIGYSLAQAADGGYLLVGTSTSGVSGLKTDPNFGPNLNGGFPEDIWVVKISSDIFPARSNSVELAVAPAFSRDTDHQGMRLSLTGISNHLHLVEASTNLVNWSMVSTNWIGSYGTMVVDTNATTKTKRFYRARTLDP